VVNIQGDEPFIRPEMIDSAVAALESDPEAVVSTLIRRSIDEKKYQDPNLVKVVVDLKMRALYFSRAAIPLNRDASGDKTFFEHIGLYCYRRKFLKTYISLPPSPLEILEKLEQLRVLENGYKIVTAETEGETWGIDTPEDLEKAREIINAR